MKEKKKEVTKKKKVNVRVTRPKKALRVDLAAPAVELKPAPIELKPIVKPIVPEKKIIVSPKEVLMAELNKGAEEKSADNLTAKPMKELIKEDVLEKENIKEEEQIEEIYTEDREEKKSFSPKLNIYRKMAFSFITLTAVLLGVIFYFSFVKVTIKITPKAEGAVGNLIIDIFDINKNPSLNKGAISGAIDKIEVSETQNYQATGQEAVGEEVSGKVTIINSYNKNQPLVATTRLLSSDNKLFRLKNTVNVPAGGSVEAEVYADKASSGMAIGPSKFTIPGLWAGLQDKIYAESKEQMSYQSTAKKHILQSDIDSAIKDIREKLIVKAENSVNEKYGSYKKKIYRLDENSIVMKIDGKADEEKDEFSVEISGAVEAAAFNTEQIIEMSREKLSLSLPQTKELKEFNQDSLEYNFSSFNFDQGSASVNISFSGEVGFKEGGSFIEKEKILGLTSEQLDDYLKNLPEVLNYEVKFSPSFIKKVPNSADRVEIK